MDSNEVTIYVSNNNINCEKVVNLMNEYGVCYELRNVSANREYMKEMQNNGIYGTPAVIIKDIDETILGFQKQRILRALNRRTD